MVSARFKHSEYFDYPISYKKITFWWLQQEDIQL